jgi:hypothetical protein
VTRDKRVRIVEEIENWSNIGATEPLHRRQMAGRDGGAAGSARSPKFPIAEKDVESGL